MNEEQLILLVEDEPLVRRVVARSLSRAGYSILEASDVDEAITLCEGREQSIALLITDLVLPGGKSGIDLVLDFTSRKPSLRCLLMSGWSPDHPALASLTTTYAYLQKPFSVGAMMELVAALLDEGPEPLEPSR